MNRQAEVLVEIGDVARWQGRLDDAQSRAAEALELLRGYAGRDENLIAFALSLSGSASIEAAQYDEATAALVKAVASGDVVLVKASRSVGLDRVVRGLGEAVLGGEEG